MNATCLLSSFFFYCFRFQPLVSVFKDGGREEKKKKYPTASLISAFKDYGREEDSKNSTSSSLRCYFVRFESNWTVDVRRQYILCNKSIQEARCIFMHVHTLSTIEKYMARLFSSFILVYILIAFELLLDC